MPRQKCEEASLTSVLAPRPVQVKAALDAAVKAGVGEAALVKARKALQTVEGLDAAVLRVLEGVGMTDELAPLLLQHDLTHIETIAHVDIPLLMSTLGISLGKAARLHRMATQLAPKVASSIKEANARQRVEL